MTPQRWQRIEEIYNSALPLVPNQRAQHVSNSCAGDEDLQAEVQSLLDADATSGEFLETQIFDFGLRIIASDENGKQTADADDPMPEGLSGTVVAGRYRIDRELGHGGVGIVYLAFDEKLHNRPLVVKVLLEKTQTHEWFVQKFLQEKEALARVDHPGIVGILDTGQLEDGQPFIAMQFVDGISLREAIKTEPEGIDLRRVASILKQAGSALSAVHSKKIYHRDLKPENIMLQQLGRGEEQVKILDFGVAKVKESLIAPSTATGSLSAGTIVYMSPEQLRGNKVTATSDIYSLGLIAYEMITGRRPFNPDTVAQLSDMQRAGVRVQPVDLRPRLPLRAQEIILRALAFEPADRFQNAAEFGEALAKALLDDEETPTLPLEGLAATAPAKTVPAGSVDPQRTSTIVTPVPPVQPVVPGPFPQPDVPVREKRIWPKLAIAFAAVLLLLGGYLVFANRARLFAAEHTFTYWLTVQKMREGKTFEEPFQSSGQEIFENGYKFRLSATTPSAGYFYVFNEGADEQGRLVFTSIYPTPAINNGSAKVDANQSLQTNWNTFGGSAGTEHFWLVWSATPVSELEAARESAFKSAEGAVTDAGLTRAVRDFLQKSAAANVETTKDTARKQTNIRGRGDLLVKMVELEHR